MFTPGLNRPTFKACSSRVEHDVHSRDEHDVHSKAEHYIKEVIKRFYRGQKNATKKPVAETQLFQKKGISGRCQKSTKR